MTRPLSDLLDVHRELEELFAAHQAALLERDFERARLKLEEFRAELTGHAEDEERCILPAYENLETTSERYVKLYYGEHRKLLAIAEELIERMAKLPKEPSAADIIAILDRECFFKDLMAHHDEREKNDLYRALDKHLSEDERVRIWERLEGL
ncbi:MAG: hemerythrin domain-containing protein [Planctomycetota bacterium]